MKQMKNKIVSACLPSFILCFLFLLMLPAKAQPPDRSSLINALEKQDCVVTEDGKVKICKFDYKYKTKTVDATEPDCQIQCRIQCIENCLL